MSVPPPLVSIVMPTFKRAHLIGESVRSVLDQTFKDFELLVRDDSSPDRTEEVVGGFSDSRIRYYRNTRNLGMPANLNEGICDSVGQFILVCHDHDLYERTMVAKMVQFLDQHPSVAYVHAGVVFVDQNGCQTGRQFVARYPELSPGRVWLNHMLSRFDCPVCANSMVRRQAYEEYGLYSPHFGFIADTEMWMRLSLHGDVGYIAQPLIQVREREPDHTYSRINWTLVDTVIRIHRLYTRRSFSGLNGYWRYLHLACRADRYLLEHYLACIKRKDNQAREEGRQYLLRSGVLLSRLAATVI